MRLFLTLMLRGGDVTFNASRVETPDCFGIAEESERTAGLDARRLANEVRGASRPLRDFGERATRVADAALATYDAATIGELSNARIAARASLARRVAALLEPAHAEHVAMLRVDAARTLRAALTETIGDNGFQVDACAALAADADLAFRKAVDDATPRAFRDAWAPALDAAFDALHDDFREALEDVELARIVDDDFDLGRPRKPAWRAFFDFLRPRLLRFAGFAINILQAQAAIRAATRAAERRDDAMPKLPIF